MDIFGIDFSWADVVALWNAAVGYVATRWLPTLGTLLIAGFAYLVGGRILKRIQRKLAATTQTDLDDELVRTIRHAFRLTVVAWALWQVIGLWVPVLGSENAEGTWVAYATQPRDWVWGIWIGVVFFPLSRFVGHVMRSFETRVISRTSETALDETALPMINRFVRFIVIAIGILLAMTHLGFEIAPLLAGAGVAGLALSLAAKDTLSNLIAGVLLIMDRPFQVGDRIELWNAPRETGTWGDVIEIGLRATKIRNPDNLVVVVPNNEIMRRDIINYTMSGEDIRLRIPFSCAYEADIERAKVLLKEVAHEVNGVKLDPAPIVIVRGFGPSEVNLQLRVWIQEARNRRRIADEITEKAMVRFARAGIEIPYPKRDLYIKQGTPAQLLPSGDKA
ncbi:MAG: mechanosensitive ion channel family protein [Gemmatimonadetes bacterium]|nr:mechanosensitive ion channel family protein [Gemmatimonadota bacterium]MXX71812.1 mechanosensitive ion channel family protein [Gemmatimonadota bacterium]MYC90603.1 mechanosensitive ion channel family protein [Gemmatimonadota bacterium]MYG36157.1 mechanosensitive ion channel family protein [Gemmatimonadota bacterium]